MELLQGLLLAVVVYFAPCGVAYARRHRQLLAIFVLNLLLGWTVLGWIAALIWACIKPAPGPVIIHQVGGQASAARAQPDGER